MPIRKPIAKARVDLAGDSQGDVIEVFGEGGRTDEVEAFVLDGGKRRVHIQLFALG